MKVFKIPSPDESMIRHIKEECVMKTSPTVEEVVITRGLKHLKMPLDNYLQFSSTFEKESALESLRRSIAKEGVLVPLRITKEGVILDGRKRYLVANMLELSIVPCIIDPLLKTSQFVRYTPNVCFVVSRNRDRTALYVDGQLMDTDLGHSDILKIFNDLGVIKSATRFTDKNSLDDVGQFPRKLSELKLR